MPACILFFFFLHSSLRFSNCIVLGSLGGNRGSPDRQSTRLSSCIGDPHVAPKKSAGEVHGFENIMCVGLFDAQEVLSQAAPCMHVMSVYVTLVGTIPQART